jgi:hypothetical protein
MNEFWTSVVTIATAIVGIAIVAVLVSNNAQTGNVIQAATGGFAQDIQAATGPVTGSAFGSTGFSGQGGGGLSQPI